MHFRPIVALALTLLLPLAVSAQALGEVGDISGDAFTLAVSPQYPAPYSQATVMVASGSLDVHNATMVATVGGKEVYRGAVHNFNATLGKTGGVTAVKVTVTYAGISYNKTISIQPQDVILIAEPLSSSPPLYLGKPHVPIDGDVRVVAVANLRDSGGASASSATYSYSWTVDGVKIANSSGVGKSTIIVASPLQYRSRDVSLVVINSSGSLVGGASLSLSAVEPSVRVYENDRLLGILFNRALTGSFNITGTESTLYSAPFSLPTTGGAPSIQWFLNGAVAQTGNSITLRPTGSGNGTASLSVVASSGDVTPASLNLSLIFGATSGTNLFGL